MNMFCIACVPSVHGFNPKFSYFLFRISVRPFLLVHYCPSRLVNSTEKYTINQPRFQANNHQNDGMLQLLASKIVLDHDQDCGTIYLSLTKCKSDMILLDGLTDPFAVQYLIFKG